MKIDRWKTSLVLAAGIVGASAASLSAAVPDAKAAKDCAGQPEVRALIWAWNSQMGALLATGGATAQKGGLVCNNGVNLRFIRQDDTSKMQEDLITFATELKGGAAHPAKGAHFVSIMGDGAATFLKGANDVLGRLGPEYHAKVIGSCGFSRGEDKFMGPPEWKTSPKASAGGLVAGVLRDGDWNIAQRWLGDHGLCNNPDEKTYDPDCLNWVNTATYIDAAEKYVAGYCETRPIVKKGKKTAETKNVCVNGVVTWTPGDVTVAEKKGGLVSIVSTKEYASQMPNVIIGIDKWMQGNRATVEGMLSAFFAGADIVKKDPAMLKKGAQISADVYKEAGADAAYWEKYFNVVTVKDKQGLSVELGGSAVSNLDDNLKLFGVGGGTNLFAATYKAFGDVVVAQYADLVPSYYPADKVLDTSYLVALSKKK